MLMLGEIIHKIPFATYPVKCHPVSHSVLEISYKISFLKFRILCE